MLTVKLYENDENDLVAVVLEDGIYSNYISCPEIVAFDADSFFEEARLGFPDAVPYEFVFIINLTLEEAAEKVEKDGTLIAEIGENIVIYPHRVSEFQQEFFRAELGDDVWENLLEEATGDDGIELDI